MVTEGGGTTEVVTTIDLQEFVLDEWKTPRRHYRGIRFIPNNLLIFTHWWANLVAPGTAYAMIV
jgi:hypothetical protein